MKNLSTKSSICIINYSNYYRENNALFLSLVARQDDVICGHIAFSPVKINGKEAEGWYALGPLSVAPDKQGQGIGRALIEAGLDALRRTGAKGCVLTGDRLFYARFGFQNDTDLIYEGAPIQDFHVLFFSSSRPKGKVEFHSAFDLKPEEVLRERNELQATPDCTD